ncbi:DivIVA domain-containing protein [Thermus scotoductus]|uniref:Cell division protein DivIVA n=1 Tax=Thermus scotoductus TaxID=37636 RepID=A0A430RR87_THESC|nr:DivIVA domain-containing protein [Thermus scotoductus]RTH21770.1 cell division protein DivIVA [Thermus scotoductus]RTI33951.1 cell division protein DivIVA [Thermus scotoductus]
MDLTPLDIRYQEFPTGLRGYQKEAVRAYLARVAEVLEGLIQENEDLRNRVRALEEEVARLKEAEGELKRAVVAAERIARELKAQAEKEADLIRKEALAAKDQVLREAAEELRRLKGEVERVKQEKTLFVAQLKALLQGYLDSLKHLEEGS